MLWDFWTFIFQDVRPEGQNYGSQNSAKAQERTRQNKRKKDYWKEQDQAIPCSASDFLHYFPNKNRETPTKQQVVEFLLGDFEGVGAYRVAQDGDDKIWCYVRFGSRLQLSDDGAASFAIEDFGMEFQTVKTNTHRELVKAFCEKDPELLSFGEVKWMEAKPKEEDDVPNFAIGSTA